MFCGTHLRAPAGQRGGWLSAEKRRRARAASPDTALDASNIARRLWVGSRPPFDRDLPEFDVLVLCAREIQPKADQIAYRGKLVHAPLPDSVLTDPEIRIALHGGRSVARALMTGKRVLVTCAAGLNRSALVAGLGLGMVTRMRATEIVDLIRARRAPSALHNASFVELLRKFERSRG